ncbi:hypothetical protein DVH24_008496 [Malus domestica]|uniref:RRM domain-containing protein n=1 Tax=Malus domestica TaxID=3750 RepID=A0A498JLS1_MALDO|nr:hypothetical protein DVH24_008496 [Malus domestica]
MFFRGVEEGISDPLAGDHYGSPVINLTHLTRSPICAEGAQSQLTSLLLSSSPLLQALATSAFKPHSKNSAVATVLLLRLKTGIHASTMTSAPRLLHEHSFSDTTKNGPEVVLNLSIISATPEAKFPSLLTAYYGGYLKDKFGWVNWYLVGKFVKKNLYALHLFDDMFKRHTRENMSLSNNLEALDIVVLVCRYLPKDLAASFTEENGTLANDQIFQQPGWCHTLTDPCDNISYQRVVFNQRNKFNKRNYAIWLMERPCILFSFKVVEENGKRKGFRFVHFDKEDSTVAAASALNDTISKGKDLYVSIFVQKSKNDNRLQIFSNTLNPALSQEVVCYKGLELVTNITEACNNHVFGQIVLLLVHSFSDTTMIRLLEKYANLKGLQDGHFRQEEEVFAMLSHKYRNDPFKIKEIISMVTNSLTSLLNLEIDFKILLQDGTITASILFFLVYGMHFKEQWKSRTTPYVTVPEQHCVSHQVFSYVIGKRWILVELELHHKKTGRCIQMLTFGSEEKELQFSISNIG